MNIFKDEYKEKYWRLVLAIDSRLKLYEKLIHEGSPELRPPGLDLICQEFRNLKIRSWEIQTGEDVSKLVKEKNIQEIREYLMKGKNNVDDR